MSTPTQKHTKSRTRRGRSMLALKKRRLTSCPQCKKPILPHRACPYCGSYRGKKILEIKTKKSKTAKAPQEKKE